MRIIPAIDIINGKCVRLSKGAYETSKIYSSNPLEIAKEIEDAGLEYLHLVDLDGAQSNHVVNHKILEKITRQTTLKVDFGGGIKSDEDVLKVIDCGANQFTGGSIAVANPPLFLSWLEKYGKDKIILGADCNHRKIASNGWQTASELDVNEFIQSYLSKGIEYVVCTDIQKDGMLEGPSIELYHELVNLESIKLIASGGVSSIKDVEQLKIIGCEAVIIGKALYEKRITLKELKELC